ncbi:MAG: PTS glucose transporter subunit IIA [Lachnospiraceae bacterium]|jgi:PTS system beta-glucosides-specific IIC component|nr:PTS glucose transporter subunit IIA [Lachnospiraceae bacterium]
MAKIRDYGKLAADIKNSIGEQNIISATHCATRLRLFLREDPSDDITKKIEQMPGVIQVVKAGGQYQIVIGMHAKDVYEELSKIMTFSEDTPDVKVGFFDKVIATIAGSMVPFLYVLAGGGLLQGVLIIIRLIIDQVLHMDSATVFDATGFGTLYNIISWTPFNFMPAFIAVSGSKHFKCNPFIALWCCCALINPGFTEMANGIAAGNPMKFLFIPMTATTYSGTVIPAIVMVAVLAVVEKKLNNILPEDFRALFLPVCCVIIMVPLTVLLIGPATTIVADAVAKGYQFLYNLVPWLANGIVAFFWQVFVIFGVHHSFTPVATSELATSGFTIFFGMAAIAVCAQAAACFGVWFKTKNSEMKRAAYSAGVTGLFGITEPAIYGVTLRLKKPFFCGAAAAAVGGIVASFFGTRYFKYPGMVGFSTIPCAIYDKTAQELCESLGTANPDFSRGIYGALIGTAIACVLAFVLVQIVGFEDPVEIPPEDDAADDTAAAADEGLKDTTVCAPMNGRVIPLAEVPDEVFSSGMLGQGVAIDPSEGKLYAPFDGTVSSIFDTKHAFTLTNAAGAEMLIHMGIDTVQLGGKYFTPKVSEGAEVKKGDLLAEFDINAIRKEYKMITPVLMTNAEDYASLDIIKDSGDVKVGEPLYTAKA